MMERKTMLVTGASGFLGSRIAAFYRERYGICAPAHGEMDITDRDSVESVFARIRPDYAVHCAAISDIGTCAEAPELSWKINVDGSRNLAEVSACYGTKCILSSSDQVYFGSTLQKPHSEDEDLQPGNLYGREKKMAEEECLRVNPDCVLLRLSWMYDVRVIRPQEHGDFFRGLIPKLDTAELLEYPVHDMRGITDVNEVVCNLEKAFVLKGGVYNFGSPNDRNMYETVLALFRGMGWDTARLVKNEERYASEPRNLCMDLRKLEENGIYFQPTAEALIQNGRR
jgi:dTDP-4-dehydrorhamnose reductase